MPYKNKEDRKKNNIKWRANNPEYNIKWRENNPEYNIKWRENNKDYYKEYRKNKYIPHPRILVKKDPLAIKENNIIRMRKYRVSNLEKIKARSIVFVEVRAGRIKRSNCVVCGKEKSEAHHPDYSKPLEVI